MTYKVKFHNNIPVEATEAANGVVQKKYTLNESVTEFDWILVEAKTSDAALAMAAGIENKANIAGK